MLYAGTFALTRTLEQTMEDLIAQFLANGGTVNKVPTGARTMTGTEMKRAIGYEPTVQTVYLVQMVDECGTPCSEKYAATSASEAIDMAMEDYPEARDFGARPNYR